MHAHLDVSALRRSLAIRLAPTTAKMQRIADKAQQQVNERFETGGVSGGVAWPPGKMPTGKSPPLSGLQSTFHTASSHGEALVASGYFVTLVHHLGTRGKGGILPDIVPVHAKALFIPLTQLGKESYEAMKGRSPKARTIYAGISHVEPASQDPTAAAGPGMGTAVYGKDFIFLSKVALPPRPQLPTSDHERAELATFTMQVLKE